MNGVNLIPASRLEAHARKVRVRTWACVLTATAMLSASAAVAFRALWSLDQAPIRAEIAKARAAIEAADAALIKVRGEIATLDRADRAARMVGDHPDWSLLLLAINQARGDAVSLSSFDLRASPPAPAPAPAASDPRPQSALRQPERFTLKLKGIATDISGVMTFVEKLEALGVMEKVAMKQSRAEAFRGVTVTGFDIECSLTERAATAATASAEKEGRP
jgi:Tfp pilus assembly protein PilN